MPRMTCSDAAIGWLRPRGRLQPQSLDQESRRVLSGVTRASGCAAGCGETPRPGMDDRVPLIEADLSYANLTGADLVDADLTGANLRGADLFDADLRESDLCRANLRSVDLVKASLIRADLVNADLRLAELAGADLTNAPPRRQTRGCRSHPRAARLGPRGRKDRTRRRAHDPGVLGGMERVVPFAQPGSNKSFAHGGDRVCVARCSQA
jgi:hypothetical protein